MLMEKRRLDLDLDLEKNWRREEKREEIFGETKFLQQRWGNNEPHQICAYLKREWKKFRPTAVQARAYAAVWAAVRR